MNNKKIINSLAYNFFRKHILRPYKLNSKGCKTVINSNVNLNEDYFDALNFPISSFWQKYFCNKLKILEPKKKNVFLDVACGTGTLCLNIMPHINFKKCIAIDNSARALKILIKRKKANQNIIVKKDDLSLRSFKKNSVDGIFGNSFLHHIPDNYKFLKQAKRILKPNGVIIFTGEPTTNAEFLETFFSSIVKKIVSFFGYKKNKIVHINHISDIWLYEKKSLINMLTECGFKDLKIKSFGFFVPLFNLPTKYFFKFLFAKSLQPDWFWRLFGSLDKVFFWIPSDYKSHYIIAGRK
jgi:ubiquinone/menaquinone biosynthesis C-methylase UbiE